MTVDPETIVLGPEVADAPEPRTWSAEDIFELGESGDMAICPDVSLLDDIESLRSSPVATVLVPPDPLELMMNDPRDVAIWRE